MELLPDPTARREVEPYLDMIRTSLASEGVIEASMLALAPVLIIGAVAARAGLRRLSIMALMRLRLKPAAPVLVHAFHEDTATSVRKEALFALVHLLGDDVESYVEEAFDDNQSGVREHVAWLAYQLSPALLARMEPRLRKLLNDPEESVRRNAQVGIYHCERLSKKVAPDGHQGLSPSTD